MYELVGPFLFTHNTTQNEVFMEKLAEVMQQLGVEFPTSLHTRKLKLAAMLRGHQRCLLPSLTTQVQTHTVEGEN